MDKGLENIVIGLTLTLGLTFAVIISNSNSSVAYAQTNVTGSALTSSAIPRNGNSITVAMIADSYHIPVIANIIVIYYTEFSTK
jgi:hypothetical protein